MTRRKRRTSVERVSETIYLMRALVEAAQTRDSQITVHEYLIMRIEDGFSTALPVSPSPSVASIFAFGFIAAERPTIDCNSSVGDVNAIQNYVSSK